MVFTHALDSVIVSSKEVNGQKLEEIKRTGIYLSLKDLMSPFGLSKGRLTTTHPIRNSSCHRCEQTLSCVRKPSDTLIGPIVIVGPEHSFVRRREHSKESSNLHVPKPDTGLPVNGLPGPDTKLHQSEYSDSRPHGLRETYESHRDSSSEIQTAPFSHEHLVRLSRKEATSSTIIPQATVYNYTQPPSMSSPKCYKQMSRRSRSIAIKAPQPPSQGSQADTIAAEEDSASNERMYDWATWRMYNRIVDHRRNQRLSSPSLTQPDAHATSTAMTLPHTAFDDYDNGGVFEMEI